MARLRQQHPSNYRSNGTISDEFENLVRYLNSAERGNRTLGELLAQLFDTEGRFAGPIRFRVDSTAGLQVRIGDYQNPTEGWQTLASMGELRGPAGKDLGTIDGPLFYNRRDYDIAGAPMGVSYVAYPFSAASSTLVVYRNGLLVREAGYATDTAQGRVYFTEALVNGDRVVIFTVRANDEGGFERTEWTAAQNQVVFPFGPREGERYLIFRNGVLQREGAGSDYVASVAQQTITFTAPLEENDVVTALRVEQNALTRVAGLMLEDEWVVNGFIPWAKLGVENGAIPAEKVFGLAAVLADAATAHIGATPPPSPTYRKLWIDTSEVPNVLRFHNGVQWLRASAITALPEFTTANAGQYVRLNGTGTALVYTDPDHSTLVLKEKLGVADGVATLDSNAKVPLAQLPAVAKGTFWSRLGGSVANGSYLFQRLFKMKVRIEAVTFRTGGGTCEIQLQVNGTSVGAVQLASVTTGAVVLPNAIELDATAASLTVGYAVTNQASATDLEVGFTYAVVP